MSREIRIHTIPINVGDFLGDIAGMDTRDVGAYILLFIAHVQIGEEGLPCDPKKLAMIARVSNKAWNNGLGDRVLEKFFYRPSPDGDPKRTRLVNESCLEVIERVNQRSSQNQANALKGWDKRKANALPPNSERNAIQRQNQKY